MTRFMSRALLVAAVVAIPLASASAEPFDPHARNDGVSVTITKQSNYLNTRTTPSGPTTTARYETSAVYQSSFTPRNVDAFSRYPLPGTFDLPGR